MSGILGSTVLETVFGLSFIYFLLSLICSGANELLAGIFKWRARQLEGAIEQLFHDPTLARQVLEHPLITSLGISWQQTPTAGINRLFRWLSALADRLERGAYAEKPSYIPGRTFAMALFDVLAQQTAAPEKRALITVAQIRKGAYTLAETALVSLIEQSRNPRRLVDSAEIVKPLLADLAKSPALAKQLEDADTIDELRAIVLKLDPGPIQRAALSLIASAQVNLDDLRGHVETWYNDVMDRVQGAYKRRIQIYLLFIALFVSCALGADTLRIIRTLSTDAQLRAFVVSEAERTTGKGGALALQTNTVTETVTVSVGAGSTVTTTTTTAPSMSAVVEELDRLRQLFGYGDLLGAAATTGSAQGGGGWGNWLLLALSRLLGVAITALAASIGAPFWFDVLQRVANLRAAGKPPAPSPSAGQPPPGESGRPQSAS